MSERRKRQLLYIGSTIVLWLVFFFFGKEIFSFLGRTLVYWVTIVAITLLLIEACFIVCRDQDIGESKGYSSFLKFINSTKELFKNANWGKIFAKDNNGYGVSKSEEEGEAIPPVENKNE